ncbi:MAG: cytochrome c biogenesis protein CcsA [Bacteroidales bacterium]|nr:cytochrome c biogenesis protein CcsA [Bacteroidales bacterium]
MTAATVLEKLRGPEAALGQVYHSPWFMILWGVAAVTGMVFLLSRGASRQMFTLGMHLAFALILVGALVTHLTGESGALHLREGAGAFSYEKEDGPEAALDFGLRLDHFSIDYYPGTRRPKDYRSEVTLLPGGEKRTISMNHILKWGGYRFYQADYDEDLCGSILAVSHDPWGVGITYAGYFLLLVCVLGFFFQKGTAFRSHCSRLQIPHALKVGLIVVGALLLAGCFWLICRKWIFEPLVPVLRSPLLWIHVVSMIISYTIFALVAVIGVVGLFLREENARRKLQTVSLIVLYPAVFLLAFGTFLGAVWANISWGSYWAWDPKETWALVTLLIYAFALHGESLKVFQRPRFFHAFCIIAFLSVLITYFGVNLILGGMHSYA